MILTRAAWYIYRRVGYIGCQDELTEEALERITQAINQFVNEGESPVHVLLDIRFVKNLSAENVLRLREITSAMTHHHLGWLAIISDNLLMNIGFRRTARSYDNTYQCVLMSTLDQGIQLLVQDCSLDFTLANSRVFGMVKNLANPTETTNSRHPVSIK